MNKPLAAGISAAALLVAGTTAGVKLGSNTAAPTGPPAPIVTVAAVDTDKIVLDWGPGQPGELKPGTATARSLVVSWKPSVDTLHPTGLTYTIQKNGKNIVTGRTVPNTKVGFTRLVRTFRMCVTAVNINGTKSSPMCATFTGTPNPPS